jgi:hypothetical protein
MRYEGSCHCGKIAFAVEGEIKEVMECNCSICAKRGSLMWFTPRAALHLTTPESNLSTYTFNKHRIRHHFCNACGCAPFAEGADSKGNPTAAVNVRCVDGIDLASLERKQFDGRSL